MKNIVFIVLLFLTTGCYEDYLVINSSFSNITIDSDTTHIYFYHSLQAGMPPKGIARFPDGGKHKNIYKNLSLYCYNTKNNSLNKIYDFGNLPECGWEKSLSISNNLIAFNINPSLGWRWRIKNSSTPSFAELSNQLNKVFIYDVANNTINDLKIEAYTPTINSLTKQLAFIQKDSSFIHIKNIDLTNLKTKTLKSIKTDNHHVKLWWYKNDLAYKQNQNYYLINNLTHEVKMLSKQEINIAGRFKTKELKLLLEDFTYADWGLDLKEKWVKKKSEYINDIILLNGNFEYRKAILQSIQFSTSDIRLMLTSITKRSDKLKAYEKQKYDLNAQETIDLLKNY